MLVKDSRMMAMKRVVLKLLVTSVFFHLLPYIPSNCLQFSIAKYGMEPGGMVTQ
jgi:hypothetical protein